MKMKNIYQEFISSEKTAGFLLLFCTFLSMLLANSAWGDSFLNLLHFQVFSKSLEFYVNDGLMTFFFLLVGLEIERELYIGELSTIKKSMMPILAAIGGMLVPAAVHVGLNYNTPTANGFGIPMATDIAFSLVILSLLGNRIPLSLKIFLTALAIIDDVGAIFVIALFYSKGLSFYYLFLSIGLFAGILLLNRIKVMPIWIYLIFGVVMWFFMYQSGIHPTITGVLLAFAIPFKKENEAISYRLQHQLHRPVAFIILPLFALINTAIVIHTNIWKDLSSFNSVGIMLGLCLGKPVGIFCFSFVGMLLGICDFPDGVKRQHVFWTGCLAGIGFTMSIFITLLAFDTPEVIISSKLAIIMASVISGIIGYLGLRFSFKKGTNGKS